MEAAVIRASAPPALHPRSGLVLGEHKLEQTRQAAAQEHGADADAGDLRQNVRDETGEHPECRHPQSGQDERPGSANVGKRRLADRHGVEPEQNQATGHRRRSH